MDKELLLVHALVLGLPLFPLVLVIVLVFLLSNSGSIKYL